MSDDEELIVELEDGTVVAVEVGEPLRPDRFVCDRCGSMRLETDLAQIGDYWYCHPSLSTGETCYQRESWASARLLEKDGHQ